MISFQDLGVDLADLLAKKCDFLQTFLPHLQTLTLKPLYLLSFSWVSDSVPVESLV